MRGRNLRILGLSLLALVGVMAVSASAAQAKWLLLRNSTSVLNLELAGTLLLAELLVPDFGQLEIHCTGGTATATISLNGTHTVASGTAHGVFTGCVVLGAEGICFVSSPETEVGEILASGSGLLSMNGTEVYSLVESEEFTQIDFSGEECPLDGLEAPVSGSATLNILNPLTDAQTHLVQIDDEELEFAGSEAILDGELLQPGVHDDWVLAHMQEVSNATWAIHLVNL